MQEKRLLQEPAMKITSIYILLGVAWIYLSDEFLISINIDQYKVLQTYKGVFYVLLTAALLWYLLNSLNKEQKERIAQLEQDEIDLMRSEARYRLLFEGGPLPKWIFDIETLRFLDVNQEAVKHYGYSYDQFMSMTIEDIRPPEDVQVLYSLMHRIQQEGISSFSGQVRHRKANGEIIHVYVHSNIIEYKGCKAKVVTASDITASVNYIQAIEEQNRKLQDISWTQSHVVRAPLTSLMGFISLLKEDALNEEEKQFAYKSIIETANKLDEVITGIITTADNSIYKNEEKRA